VVDVKVCSRRDKASDATGKKSLQGDVAKIKRQYDERIEEIRTQFVELVRDDSYRPQDP
jgi:hypothetical protein